MGAVSSMDIGVVMRHIGSVYSFTEDKYPPLQNVAFGPELTAFAINHSLKHMAKTVGAIAMQCEAADHGAKMDLVALRTQTVKMAISALNLANALDIKPEELVRAIYKEVK